MHVLCGAWNPTLCGHNIQLHLMGAESCTWGKRALSLAQLQECTNTLFDPSHRLPTHSHSYPSLHKKLLKRIRASLWVIQSVCGVQRTRQGSFQKHTKKLPMSTNHCLINRTEFLLLSELHSIANTPIHKIVSQWQEAPDRSDIEYIYIYMYIFQVSSDKKTKREHD